MIPLQRSIRIGNLIKNGVSRHSRINHIHETIEGLQNGDMKECPKCKEIRSVNDFKDSSLLSDMADFVDIVRGTVRRKE